MITGLVGMAGGIGGFYLASSLGYSRQITGNYQLGLTFPLWLEDVVLKAVARDPVALWRTVAVISVVLNLLLLYLVVIR